MTAFSVMILRSILLLMLTCHAYANGNQLFRVAPSGSIDLNIIAVKISNIDPVSNLMLRHKLIYDGDRFISKIFFPLLDSYIVKRTKGTYFWRDLQGGGWDLREGQNVRPGKVINLHFSGGFATVSVQEDTASALLIYYRGSLRAISVGDSIIEFIGARGRVTRILLNGHIVLHADYSRNGEMRLASESGEAIVKADESGEYYSIDRIPHFGTPFSCSLRFESGLLREIKTSEGTADFSWAPIKYADGHNNHGNLVAVVDDSRFEYGYKLFRGVVSARFKSKFSSLSGGWVYDFGTGGLIEMYYDR